MAHVSKGAVTDLRGALELAEERGELVRVSRPVDPGLELPTIMHALGKLPSKPAVLFEQIAGAPGVRGCGGIFSDMSRFADMLGLPHDRIARKQAIVDALDNPLPPRVVASGACKENIVTKNIDIDRLIFSTRGAKHVTHRYITPVVIIKNPKTGVYNTSVYRSCVQGPDTVTSNIRWSEHGGFLLSIAKEMGISLPVALCIGVSPTIYAAAITKVPLGYDELGMAGALAGRPVKLVPCETIDLNVPAEAEFVIEGEIRPPYRLGDDGPWPEYLDYLGMNIHPPIMDVTAVTYRNNPINQLFVPGTLPSMPPIGTEAQVYRHMKSFFGDFIVDTRNGIRRDHRITLKVKKTEAHHEGLQISAAYAALGFDSSVDTVILVDEDINIYDEENVWWAIVTRCNPVKQVHVLPEARTHQNVPIAGVREMVDEPIVKGKLIIDATIPWNYRNMEKSPGITYFSQASWDAMNFGEFLEGEQLEKWSNLARKV